MVPLRPVDACGTTDAAAQIPVICALPAFATTRTTRTRGVGGNTEVEPAGGSCIVVVVDVEVVVVEVEVVEELLVVPGSVVEVVVLVEVVVVVGGVVVVVGRPSMRTTGGSTVTATITRSAWTCSSAEPESSSSQAVAEAGAHEAGSCTHLEAGRLRRPLDRGREITKAR
jgi:hypothetical protein